MKRLHPYTWVGWTLFTFLLALSLRNPYYLLLLITASWLHLRLRSSFDTPTSQSWRSLTILAGVLVFLTVPFHALLVHVGEHTLFSFPRHWILIGGPITAEAILYGFTVALQLLAILLVFAVLNTAVSPGRLLRLGPRWLMEGSTIAGIGLTFIPQLARNLTNIRLAQQARGIMFRGVRSYRPLVAPLLTLSLEQSIDLAESMESRGFGLRDPKGHLRRTRYQVDAWQRFDLVLLTLFLLLLGVLFYWHYQAPERFLFDPYQSGTLAPRFEFRFAVVCLASFLPVLGSFRRCDVDR